jgi:hypothetical protein
MHPLWTLAAPLLAAALLALPGQADLLTPGHKPVRHELSLDLEGAPPGWTFVAAPVRGFGGVTELEDEVPFTFSSKYGTRIYGLPPGTPVPAEFDRAAFDAFPACAPGVRQVASVPLANPVARVLSRLAVDELADEDGLAVLSLEVLGHQQWTASGEPLDDTDPRPVLFGLAGLGLVGLVLLRSSREVQP